jgi:DNA-binding NtrC family response regulator
MRPVTILLVDQDKHVRDALCEALQCRGHEVHAAASGEEAWDILRDRLVDVVLMDLRMPAMSGQTLFHVTVSRWPELRSRVAILTEDPAVDRNDPWIRLYRLPVIQKPPRLQQILAVVADMVADAPREANGEF